MRASLSVEDTRHGPPTLVISCGPCARPLLSAARINIVPEALAYRGSGADRRRTAQVVDLAARRLTTGNPPASRGSSGVRSSRQLHIFQPLFALPLCQP